MKLAQLTTAASALQLGGTPLSFRRSYIWLRGRRRAYLRIADASDTVLTGTETDAVAGPGSFTASVSQNRNGSGEIGTVTATKAEIPCPARVFSVPGTEPETVNDPGPATVVVMSATVQHPKVMRCIEPKTQHRRFSPHR